MNIAQQMPAMSVTTIGMNGLFSFSVMTTHLLFNHISLSIHAMEQRILSDFRDFEEIKRVYANSFQLISLHALRFKLCFMMGSK